MGERERGRGRQRRRLVDRGRAAGERKLKTTVSIVISARTAELAAFVIRHPDENAAEFNRWLLRKNMKLAATAFGVDHLGDVYLRATVPVLRLLDDLDGLLGEFLTVADESFNELLLIGFLTGMKKEWAWRVSRGESTRNLAAFEHVLSGPDNEFLGTIGPERSESPGFEQAESPGSEQSGTFGSEQAGAIGSDQSEGAERTEAAEPADVTAPEGGER
ncbi:YbjN domain-containing protein [Brevibacterium sp. XM4083]|uniref:YbjN domain-containing protein n=1 Tax=Brevibacterium sp. XM4083 TaxID=2583238 RepID=UPI00202E2A17|nr:YbjN domain-containing protein [Brevibacterium sp. XM4083]